MNTMFQTLFGKRNLSKPENLPKNQIVVDIHSHILPNLDDGAESIEQSLLMVKGLYSLGYRKLIATPHVMSGYYQNTSAKILEATLTLKNVLRRQNIPIEIEAAAEYYLENGFFHLIEQGDILTFGGEKKYLLFETSFVEKASYLLESVLKIKQAGYTPVLAHPERYAYLEIKLLERLSSHGVLFQINANSLAGYYTKQAQEMAELMISKKMVSFIGSDCHNETQLENLNHSFNLPYYQVVMKQNLLNNSLIETTSKIHI
jgi:protein-tyrosine phosphatase